MCKDKRREPTLPELKTLILCHLDILPGSENDLLDFLRWRRSKEAVEVPNWNEVAVVGWNLVKGRIQTWTNLTIISKSLCTHLI